MPVSTITSRKLWLATALNKVFAAAELVPESPYLHRECIGLDSAESSKKTQELAKYNSPDLCSLSSRQTSDSNISALIWNQKRAVSWKSLNGAHPTWNLQWDPTSQQADASKDLAGFPPRFGLKPEVSTPCLPPPPECYSTINYFFTFNTIFTLGPESALPLSDLTIPVIPCLGGN